MPVYHPDVRVWEVVREGQVIGLFYGDYFARPGKQGGAWMSSFRDQQTLDGDSPAHHHQQFQFQQKRSQPAVIRRRGDPVP